MRRASKALRRMSRTSQTSQQGEGGSGLWAKLRRRSMVAATEGTKAMSDLISRNSSRASPQVVMQLEPGKERMASSKRHNAHGSREALASSSQLHARSEELASEVEAIGRLKENAMSSSLPRKLATALSTRLETVNKHNAMELLREIDTNGDGVIQKIELRQMVRNKLKIKADNSEIDKFFDSIDIDGGGTIDLNELIGACHKLHDAGALACCA